MRLAMKHLKQGSLIMAVLAGFAAGNAVALEARDFSLDEDGTVVVVNHRKGTRLHLDYVGAEPNTPLRVVVKAEHEGLKITPRTCKFSRNNRTCELILKYVAKDKPVYGNQTFSISEATGQDHPSAPPAPAEVKFVVGTKSAEAPIAMGWVMTQSSFPVRIHYYQKGPIIIQNGTASTRDYKGEMWNVLDYSVDTQPFSLPAGNACYLDGKLIKEDDYNKYNKFYFYANYENWTGSAKHPSYIGDITNNGDIYNLPYSSATGRLSSCSAKAVDDCASNKWASWTVGMFNLSDAALMDPDTKQIFMPGTERILRNNAWNSGDTLYYGGDDWVNLKIALVLLQGTTDGSGFDPESKKLSQNQIVSAPPCSDFVKQ